MPENTPAPVEAADPFEGQEVGFVEYSEYRKTGELPERFKAKTEGEASKTAPPAAKAETAEAQEASETEQENEGQRDKDGKFKPKVEFNPEQQEAFDRAFRKREAKIRREFEERYAAQTSASQATAAEKPNTAADGQEPTRPEPPKLSEYKGTLEQYETELKEYPAKLQAFLDAQRQVQERNSALQSRLEKSEKAARKSHPDYADEFKALAEDIQSNEEPKLPPHVLKAIAEEADDPHELTYYLAKNREEFRRLAALAPEQTLREVLKLDVKLSAAKDAPAPAKEQPKAKPKPPDPVGARASTSAFDVNDEEIDADTWAQKRNAELAKRGRH